MEETLNLIARTDKEALTKIEGFIRKTKEGVMYLVLVEKENPIPNETNKESIIENSPAIHENLQQQEASIFSTTNDI